MATPQIIADFESSISTAIAIGGTSFSLSSILDDDGVAIPGGLYYFTVDNGSSAKEYLTGTLAGSSVTGVKTVTRQGVEVSGAVRAHRVGAPCIITDFATYKKYMDGLAVAGAPTATPILAGIAKLSAAATIPAAPVVLVSNDPSIFPNAYAASSTGTDAYAITLATAPAAYATGQMYAFKADVANTGTATLNVSSLGAINILRGDGTALSDGDITAGFITTVIYDSGSFRLASPRVTTLNPTIQTFTASGTYTPSAGTKYAVVEVQASGGAGAGISNGTGRGANGGGAGGYAKKILTAATIGASQTVTINAAGTGASNASGTAGGTTTFGAILTANGGNGGTTVAGGFGVGGTATGGDINIQGGNGGGALTIGPSGPGGNSQLGRGGNGIGVTNTGVTGTGYGSGGSGAYDSSGGGAAGGNGAPGFVIITEYYS